jgi:hypothetical protein
MALHPGAKFSLSRGLFRRSADLELEKRWISETPSMILMMFQWGFYDVDIVPRVVQFSVSDELPMP